MNRRPGRAADAFPGLFDRLVSRVHLCYTDPNNKERRTRRCHIIRLLWKNGLTWRCTSPSIPSATRCFRNWRMRAAQLPNTIWDCAITMAADLRRIFRKLQGGLHTRCFWDMSRPVRGLDAAGRERNSLRLIKKRCWTGCGSRRSRGMGTVSISSV